MGGKKLGIILVALVVVVAAGFGIWRLWPHSFQSMMGVEEANIASIDCLTSHLGVYEESEDKSGTYKMDALTPESPEFAEVIGLLSKGKFRQDFRNLLTGVGSVGVDGIALNVIIVFEENGAEGSQVLTLFGDGTVVVNSKAGNGGKVYHLTHKELVQEIATYIQAKGKKQ